jgi:hypothetical protein
MIIKITAKDDDRAGGYAVVGLVRVEKVDIIRHCLNKVV